jgi:hypothetical protein
MTLDDDATMREEHFRETALKKRKPNGPVAVGHCLFCNALLDDNRRWCDEWCRDDWNLEQESRKRHRGRY